METLQLTAEIVEAPGSLKQPIRRTRKPEIRHWKEEERKRKKETLNWILKRGYWKPDTPAPLVKSCREIWKKEGGK